VQNCTKTDERAGTTYRSSASWHQIQIVRAAEPIQTDEPFLDSSTVLRTLVENILVDLPTDRTLLGRYAHIQFGGSAGRIPSRRPTHAIGPLGRPKGDHVSRAMALQPQCGFRNWARARCRWRIHGTMKGRMKQ
jgi:hypothetical protein